MRCRVGRLTQQIPHSRVVIMVGQVTGQRELLTSFGGDRYRLQAFVDPVDGRATPATGASAVRCETGRICVWRHVLFSRVLIKPVPVLPPATDARGTQMRLTMLGYDTGPIDGDVGPRTRLATQAFQRNNPPIADDGKVLFDSEAAMAAFNDASRAIADLSVEQNKLVKQGAQTPTP